MVNKFFDVNGEDYVVAENERQFRKIYKDYHGEKFDKRRYPQFRCVPHDETITMVDDNGEEFQVTAGDVAESSIVGYYKSHS